MRKASAAMTVLFIFWAGFQYNDPDGLLWGGVYGLAALVSLLAFLRRLPPAAAAGACAAAAAGGLLLAIQVITQGQFFFDEMGREMLGLFIISIWMGILWGHLRRQRQRNMAG